MPKTFELYSIQGTPDKTLRLLASKALQRLQLGHLRA